MTGATYEQDLTGLFEHGTWGGELHVTVIKDASASYSDSEMHAALEVNIPNYAGAILTADGVVDALNPRRI
jgi:nicotinamidase-related amidase